MLEGEHTRPDAILPVEDGQCHLDFGRILRSAIVPDRSNFHIGEVLEVFQPLAIQALLCSRTSTLLPMRSLPPSPDRLRSSVPSAQQRLYSSDGWRIEAPSSVPTLLRPRTVALRAIECEIPSCCVVRTLLCSRMICPWPRNCPQCGDSWMFPFVFGTTPIEPSRCRFQ